eukprot:TRINITY_DN9598_c0_g1_i2.p1 TRINITY_DN9598_c0_g1~~TRINITY_DN9598_c0_g1_i2.p1  ORF type:complete len:595 (+),score=113.64 TRINITY_DN9598_c0_g1_i2:94-1785(+)
MAGQFIIALLILKASALIEGEDCNLQHDIVLGDEHSTFDRRSVSGAEDCCAACQASSGCGAFTFEPSNGVCYLKHSAWPLSSKSGAISGTVASSSGSFNVTISDNVIFTTLPTYKSWNIDASADRQFFTRNLSNAELHYLARHSAPGLLRFGGTGNDDLVYAFGNSSCRTGTCLNASWFDNLMDFASAADTPVVFGLNIQYRSSLANGNSVWDPTNARQLLQYALQKNYTFYGFELGNEQNNALSAEQEASDFAVLQALLVELWHDKNTRPKIFGPDPHSMRTGRDPPKTVPFLRDFASNCSAKGVDLYALTHHEYIEVDSSSSLDPGVLDITGVIASAVNATLSQAAPNVLRVAGEIGPHNGGSPGCSHSSMRWATFADSFWYMDSLGAKAQHGYSLHCRQDFIGIDYGLLDCSTYQPLPDYYTGMVWGSTMGAKVLNVTVSDPSHNVRAYAHCASQAVADPVVGLEPKPGQVTLLLLNLLDNEVNVTLPRDLMNARRTAFVFTKDGNLSAPSVRLNGDVLKYSKLKLPSLVGEQELASMMVALQAQSISFFVFDTMLKACV